MQGIVFYLGIGFIGVAFLNGFGLTSIQKEATILCSFASLCFTLGSCYAFDSKFFARSKAFWFGLGTITIVLSLFLKVEVMQKIIKNLSINEDTILFLSIGCTFLSIGISQIAENHQKFKFKEALNKIYEQINKLKNQNGGNK